MDATIYTYTVIRSATEQFASRVPYVVAVLEADGKRWTSFVDGYQDGADVQIGQKVISDTNDENGNPLYRFR